MLVSMLSPARLVVGGLLCAFLATACGSDDPAEGTGALNPGSPVGAVGGSAGVGSGAGGSAVATAGAGGAPSPGASGAGPEVGAGGAVPGEAGGGAGGAPQLGVDAGGTQQPLPQLVRLVAVGDSITQSTCWRALLWQRLAQGFPGRTDFVGSHVSDNGCAVPGYDQDNEGYGSSLVTEVAAGVTTARTCSPACPSIDDLRARFAMAPADVALMHFGTNDVWNGIAPGDGNAPAAGSILAAYDAVVAALREANPGVRILVAQIIPMNVTEATCTGCTCAECPGRVTALDEQIVAWAARVATAASPVSVVDQWTDFDATVDTRDGVHPNDTGSRKMADRWYDALAPLLE